MQRGLSRNPGSSPPPPNDDPDHMGPVEAALSCLWVLTPLTATVSLVVVVIAILTNQWLHTEEKMNNPSYNGTGEKDYLSKLTISGLWTLCFTNRKFTDLNIIVCCAIACTDIMTTVLGQQSNNFSKIVYKMRRFKTNTISLSWKPCIEKNMLNIIGLYFLKPHIDNIL